MEIDKQLNEMKAIEAEFYKGRIYNRESGMSIATKPLYLRRMAKLYNIYADMQESIIIRYECMQNNKKYSYKLNWELNQLAERVYNTLGYSLDAPLSNVKIEPKIIIKHSLFNRIKFTIKNMFCKERD